MCRRTRGRDMTVKLNWISFTFKGAEVQNWKDFKKRFSAEKKLKPLFSKRAVYVIRIMRPFAFLYETEKTQNHSPVVYIGKGQFQKRITNHLKSWISQLSASIPGLQIRIMFCEPKKQRLGPICEHVEADLLDIFEKSYGRLPLRNHKREKKRGNHDYDMRQVNMALHPGSGKGFHWAIKPLPSSHFYAED